MPQSDAGEKTEKPTAKRLFKARSEGNVPASQELLSAAALIALTLITIAMGPKVVQWAMLEIKEGFSCRYSHIAGPQVFLSFVNDKIAGVMMITAPFFLALMLAGVGTSVAVSGRNFSAKALRWKFDAINPSKGLKQLLSATSLVKLITSVVKMAFIGLIVYLYLRSRLESLATFQWASLSQLLPAISGLILGLLKRVCIGFLIIGFIDLIYQKWKYIDNLKMTKQEVKDERRSMDSPPEVKKRLRQKQFEFAMRRMLQDVPKADVVLVNPTHVAVALQYDADKMPAPVVVAKGADHVSEKIREVARAYGVPIIRRPALARNLFATVDIGKVIPDSLFVAVAELLALIYRLRRSRSG
jgi:flagellar biosynthetic protein FlhB